MLPSFQLVQGQQVALFRQARQHALSQHISFDDDVAEKAFDAFSLKRRAEGRCKRLYLTPKGRELIDRVLPEVVKYHDEQFAPLSKDEMMMILGSLLQRLKRGRRAPGQAISDADSIWSPPSSYNSPFAQFKECF